MILLLEIFAVLAVIFGAAVLLTGRGEGLSDEGRDLADTGIPRDRAMSPADVVGLRFALAFRGYRMAEVDDALDRLAAELAARDEAIARLRVAHTPAEPEPQPYAEPEFAPEPEPPPPPEILAEVAEPASLFRPEVPEIPAYDPWSVTPRSRYTDGPEHIEVDHDDDHDVDAITEHHTGHAPAPEPDDEPKNEPMDEPPAWPS